MLIGTCFKSEWESGFKLCSSTINSFKARIAKKMTAFKMNKGKSRENKKLMYCP